jgi:SSS family solute:Na+ symporter
LGFSSLDYLVLVVYLVCVTAFGARFGKSQHSVRDYFLGDKSASWWVIGLSIVATETSTLTLIGIPALAFTTPAHPEQGGNFTYLQVVFGYLIGRLVICALLIPAYFQGKCQTAYALLEQRFGTSARRFAACLFLVMRALAEGVRVLAASLVLAAVLKSSLAPGYDLSIWSILIVGALTLIYTFEGGVTAVIWTDLVQLIIYGLGSLLACWELVHHLPGGLSAIPAAKLQLWSFSLDPTLPFTFWAGLIGGCFLTMASHGADQLMVQRLLMCKDQSASRKALLFSGVVVLFQFSLFLLIGCLLSADYVAFPRALPADPDAVFPTYIVERLPHGVAGLVVAAIFAAAMSNLSGSLNSLSSTTILDLYAPLSGEQDEGRLLRMSRWATLMWGVVLIAIALVARGWGSVFTTGLTIASLVYGPMLGVFLLGLLSRRCTQRGVMGGMALSLVAMGAICHWTHLAFTWYVLVGTVLCSSTGWLLSFWV